MAPLPRAALKYPRPDLPPARPRPAHLCGPLPAHLCGPRPAHMVGSCPCPAPAPPRPRRSKAAEPRSPRCCGGRSSRGADGPSGAHGPGAAPGAAPSPGRERGRHRRSEAADGARHRDGDRDRDRHRDRDRDRDRHQDGDRDRHRDQDRRQDRQRRSEAAPGAGADRAAARAQAGPASAFATAAISHSDSLACDPEAAAHLTAARRARSCLAGKGLQERKPTNAPSGRCGASHRRFSRLGAARNSGQ
ncbi:translation initiation factor IF-2-like isoform X2 [Myiozetetes cayanensis]|uniref:translation initiation factor IF-2-like isoform X2 n=1 Tax=Myiozetetes cayanensis TaxID=478635 RepID=UPI00215FD5F8|nr:translation initiation factor IF-2-like isoform X2 [Myiozetetes cayanensis]